MLTSVQGEVYRARDETLGRDVVVKTVTARFAQDGDGLARFKREAKLLASLNHPGIATLHGLEEIGANTFLVMELIEGETLAERIARGPIRIDEALPVFVQIAEALEAAHDKGILHRDLKPANIMITRDERIKILDFGLAKAYLDDAREADASRTPTLTRDTAVGSIMGTPAYMSPEQARGKPVDQRTDIWSFGVVLYEALTGRLPFVGEDISQTMAFILTQDVDWKLVPSRTPPAVCRLLRRTLERDPRERLASASDARIELRDAAASIDEAPASRAIPSHRWMHSFVAASAAAMITGFLVWRGARPPSAPVARLIVAPVPSEALELDTAQINLAVAPDGTAIVYRADSDYGPILRMRAIGELTTTILVSSGGPTQVSSPFFSPDGDWVGFVDGGELKKVSVDGGVPVRICVLPAHAGLLSGGLRGASWGDDGTIVFSVNRGGPGDGLFRVSADGGEPEALTTSDVSEGDHYWPEVLPGSRAVLFAAAQSGGASNGQILLRSLVTDRQEILIRGGTFPKYSASGHIVYSSAGQLYAIPFDLDELRITGTARPLPEQVVQSDSGAANFALSKNGTMVLVPARPSASTGRRLVWVDRTGRPDVLPHPAQVFVDVALSPDGSAIGVDMRTSRAAAARTLWIYGTERGTRTRLSAGEGEHPVWTPDSASVVYGKPGAGIAIRPVDGSADERLVIQDPMAWLPNSFSPDGSLLAYTVQGEQTGPDIWLFSFADGTSQPLVATPTRDEGPMFSPDGRFLAYASDESGIWEVFAQPYPGPGGRIPISTGGGRAPVWSPDGSEIVYRNPERDQVLAVEVDTSDGLRAGPPRMLFEQPYLDVRPGDPHYDVSRNGERLLMITPADSESEYTNLVVVLNWHSELERLVPTR